MPEPREAISLDDGQYDPAAYVEDRAASQYEPDYDAIARVNNYARESRIPAHAPRPQDHKPPAKKRKKAKKADRRQWQDDSPAGREAAGVELAEIEFDGELYAFPADPLDWDLNVTEAFEHGKVVTAVRGMLGPGQWRKVAAKGYKNRQFRELFDMMAEAGGFKNAGN